MLLGLDISDLLFIHVYVTILNEVNFKRTLHVIQG